MRVEIREDELPSEAVKRLVSEQEECSVENLGNLTDAVDVAELNESEHLPTEFHYCGYHITVNSDETINIES